MCGAYEVTFWFEEPLKVLVKEDCSYSEEQIVESAKKILIDTLTEDFPPFTYSINNENHATPIRLGQVIQLRVNGEMGVIVSIRKNYNFPIRVRLFKGNVIGVKEKDVQIVEKASIHTLIEKSRKKTNITGYWEEGDFGYLISENGAIIPIVFGLGSAYYYHAIPLIDNPNGKYIRLSKNEANKVVRTFEEAILKRKE